MFPPDSHRFCIPNLLVMSLPYNLLRANALPLLISHHIPPYLLSYPAWQISSDLLSAECIPGAKCDWLDLYRLKLVVWWSEWHLMWFVLPHAVSQFFWFSATLPLHHPELCHPKGLQAPKTSYDPRTGRDMLNFAFGTQAHCLEISWNHHQRLPAHLFICFILVSSFQWYLPSFKSSALENTVQWDVVLSFLCLCLSIEASWRLPILQLLPAPACPTMACIWCIAFRNRMTLYPLVLSMVRSCHENPNTSAALTSSQLDVNLPLIKWQKFDNLCAFCTQILYSDFWVIYVCNPAAKILVGSHGISETLWLRCSWQLFTFADFDRFCILLRLHMATLKIIWISSLTQSPTSSRDSCLHMAETQKAFDTCLQHGPRGGTWMHSL